MMKKPWISVLILLFLLVFYIPAFANTTYDKGTPATKEFYVKTSRPQNNESTLKKACFISGSTDEKGITVELYILNNNTGVYEPLVTSDGVSSFEIGASGMFIKEVDLPNYGENKILLVAIPKPEATKDDVNKTEPANKDESAKEEKIEEQHSLFTITVLKENWKDIIKSGIDDIKKVLKDMKIFK
jgi:hypothetical protein